MKLRQCVVLSLALVAACGGWAAADSCCTSPVVQVTPAQPVVSYRLEYRTVYEPQTVTAYRLEYETVYEER